MNKKIVNYTRSQAMKYNLDMDVIFIDETNEYYIDLIKQEGPSIIGKLNVSAPNAMTPEVYTAAVQLDGMVLKYVRNQTHNICMIAVSQNGMALEYVRKQSYAICMAAVKQNGLAVKFAKYTDKEILIAALTQNPNSIEYISSRAPDICLTLVSLDGLLLERVGEQNQNKYICLAAVEQNIEALQYVKRAFVEYVLRNLKR